jgi:hypothetical protein
VGGGLSVSFEKGFEIFNTHLKEKIFVFLFQQQGDRASFDLSVGGRE